MSTTVIKSHQLYRGITDVLKYINMTNQIYRDINVMASSVDSIIEETNAFFLGYTTEGALVPSIQFHTDDGDITMNFTPIMNDQHKSMCGTIGNIESILNRCKDKVDAL